MRWSSAGVFATEIELSSVVGFEAILSNYWREITFMFWLNLFANGFPLLTKLMVSLGSKSAYYGKY